LTIFEDRLTADGETPREPAQDPSVLARLHAGVLFNLVGGVFAQGSTFALNVVSANLLGRLAFGEFTVVQATLSTVGALAQVATGYTATKYVAEFRDTDPERAGRILQLCALVSTGTAIVAAIALALGASWIAGTAYGAPQLAPWLRLAAPGVLFIVMNGFRSGALAGLESYGALARIGVLSGIAYMALGTLGTYLYGVNGAVAGVVSSAGLQWGLLGITLRRELIGRNIPWRQNQPWRERDAILHFAVPASLTATVTLPAFWLASAFLVRQPGGLEQMALFGAANSFRLIVLFLPNAMNNVGMSLLNNQRTSSIEAYRRVFWWNLGLTATFVTCGALVVMAVGPILLGAFGKDFQGGYAALRVLMLAAVIESVAIWTYQVMQSHGRMWLTLFLVTLPRDCVIVTFAYLLTPKYGAAGLGAAHAAGWALALTVIAVLTHRIGLTGGPADVVWQPRQAER
jgi:O-antigen/teichoic acid export membrane protein